MDVRKASSRAQAESHCRPEPPKRSCWAPARLLAVQHPVDGGREARAGACVQARAGRLLVPDQVHAQPAARGPAGERPHGWHDGAPLWRHRKAERPSCASRRPSAGARGGRCPTWLWRIARGAWTGCGPLRGPSAPGAGSSRIWGSSGSGCASPSGRTCGPEAWAPGPAVPVPRDSLGRFFGLALPPPQSSRVMAGNACGGPQQAGA